MTEIICVHRWGPKVYYWIPPANSETQGRETFFQYCDRCNTSWYEGAPEPRIVVARLEVI